ncbi:Glutamate--tRNA ligase [Lasiodiplodia hormozganensis]|uniref:Glutamate--tRNA ligase, mitochondrial n=1 Tax=Lasiodiplodia hormozganensis TaxID=869390 RepID=A0AA39WHI0_9PEZI|nr:Glutamate--tRNA ligase [Lasiodiplodia hormozganensis]
MSLLLSLATRRANFVCTSRCLRLSRAAVRQKSDHATPQKPQKPPKKTELPDGPARTRFAPSPTGYLHLGSLRTALFNYLLAKRTGGQFLLRIEDTDQKRTVPDAEARLLEDLRWAGLEWDEGPEVGGPYGPYRQSERTALYQEHASKLLETGHAYRCFCTAERLNDLAQQRAQLGLPTDYDRKCAHIPKEEADDRAAKGEAHVVRLLVPDAYPAFFDHVYGMVGKGVKPATKKVDDAYDDPILLKSDGLPTYHLANVVDDHHMKITHVIRGTEWLPSTPRHVAMYQAFGWEPPSFAHVGLLVDKDGNKLSKRNMDIDVAAYRKQGFLPEAVNNFVVLQGWSHRGRKDAMSMQELIDTFTIKFTRGNTTVSEGKLNFLQHEHALRRLVPGDPVFDETVNTLVAMLLRGEPVSFSERILNGRSLYDYVVSVLRIDSKNYTNPSDFLIEHDYLFTDFTPQNKCPESERDLMQRVFKSTFASEKWTSHTVLECVTEAADMIVDARVKAAKDSSEADAPVEKKVKGEVYKHLRMALADGKHGPDITAMMKLLGRDESLSRMKKYVSA